MPSLTEPGGSPAGLTPRVFALALVAAASLQIMENLLPRFPLFPWMRLGLSYVIVVPFLLRYGARSAFALVLARNLLAILYGGQPLTTFLIGTGSGAVAFLGFGEAARQAYQRGRLGLAGIGVLLASAFNLSQLALVDLILIRHSGFLFQIGPLLAWSLISGLAVAALIHLSRSEIAAFLAPGGADSIPASAQPAQESRPAWIFPAGIGVLAALALIDSAPVQGLAFLALAAASRDRGKTLAAAWPFFFYLGWLHLFHTSGEFVYKDWITREGVQAFMLHSARMANLILIGRQLSALLPLAWAGESRSVYVKGFLQALPMIPGLFASSLRLGKDMARRALGGQRTGLLTPSLEHWRSR